MKILQKTKELKLIMALMSGYSIVYMDKNMISTTIIPLVNNFNLSAAQAGVIVSAFFLGYSLIQIPGGLLADKLGSKRILMLSLGSISLFSILFGICNSLLMFVIIRFLAGIGHGGYPSSCSKAVAENFDFDKRTFVQSIILTTSGIGGILAFTLGTILIGISWRYAYILLGSLFFIALILIYKYLPTNNKKDLIAKDEKNIKYKKLLNNKNIILLFISMIFLNITYYGSMSWLPSYIVKKYHLSLGLAGSILALNSVAQVIGSFGTGILLSKIFNKKEKLFIIINSIIVSISIFILINSNNLILSLFLIMIIGMLTISSFTAIFTWPQKIFSTSIIGSSIGIINTGGTLGGFLAPIIIGILIDKSSGDFSISFVFLSICILLSGLFTLLVRSK